MKRSVALISVSITAFSVVLLATVVYAVRAAAKARTSPVAAISGATKLEVSPELEAAAEVASPRISPQAAVDAASEFLKRQDAFSVQLASYNGVTAYMVTFSSGDLVYVSLQGQVLGVVPAGVEMVNSNPGRHEQESRVGGGDGGHEDGESEHESEHETEAGD